MPAAIFTKRVLEFNGSFDNDILSLCNRAQHFCSVTGPSKIDDCDRSIKHVNSE